MARVNYIRRLAICALCLLAGVQARSVVVSAWQAPETEPPNIAGHWIFVAAESKGSPTYGAEFTLKQDRRQLVLRVTVAERTYDAVYPLNHTEGRYSPKPGVEMVSVLSWTGVEFVVATRSIHSRGAQEFIRRIRPAGGDKLVVSASSSIKPGFETVTVYTRKGRL